MDFNAFPEKTKCVICFITIDHEKIKELERTIQELKKTQENTQAIYFRGSNLNNKL